MVYMMSPLKCTTQPYDIYDVASGNCGFTTLGLYKRWLDTGKTPIFTLIDHNTYINKNIPSILYTDYSAFIICNIISNLSNPSSKTTRLKNLLKKNLCETKAEILSRLFVDSITAKNVTYFIQLCKMSIHFDILWLLIENIKTDIAPASVNGHIRKFKGKFIRNNVDSGIIDNTIQLMRDGVDIYVIDEIYHIIHALNDDNIYKYFNKYFSVQNKAKYEYPKRIQDEIAALNQIRREAYPTDRIIKCFLDNLYSNINTKLKITTLLNNKIDPITRYEILSAIYASKNKYECYNGSNRVNYFAFAYKHNLNLNLVEPIIDLKLPYTCHRFCNVKPSYPDTHDFNYNIELSEYNAARTLKTIANVKEKQLRCSVPVYTIQASKLAFGVLLKVKDTVGTINMFLHHYHAMPLIPK